MAGSFQVSKLAPNLIRLIECRYVCLRDSNIIFSFSTPLQYWLVSANITNITRYVNEIR